mgnify:CR=1 FL=1
MMFLLHEMSQNQIQIVVLLHFGLVTNLQVLGCIEVEIVKLRVWILQESNLTN